MINADVNKKLYRNNKGGAMVMVIVIIAFISILAAVLMFVAYAGYQMRIIDKQGKDNFYTAETVLDEINVGLQGEISEALTVAYSEVMNNFALYKSANERNKQFHEIYFEELKNRLADSSDPDSYDVDILRGYLSDEIKGKCGDGSDGDGSRATFETNGIAYGAIVESNLTPAQYTLDVDNTSRIIIKDLKVSYVNRQGYISIISTDIRISLPSFNFSQASALPSLESCSMIADDTLLMGNENAGGNIVIKGDVYAGQMLVGTPADPVYSTLNADEELTLPTLLSTNVIFEKADDAEPTSVVAIVSRENIEVAQASSLETTDTEIWGRNLTLTSASADLSGTINLKDDFTLLGNGSTAVLEGEYNGFGYLTSGTGSGSSGEGDSSGSTDTRPDSSSAIIINGKDSLLDLSGLDRMTISGRAYVSTAYSAADTTATEQEKSNTSNIMMGESVAVKSNQLIYLVPAEALGCRIDVDGTLGSSEFGSNPLTLEQYEEIITNPDKYCLLDGSRQIPSLGYKSLNQYISQETIAGGDPAYVPEIIFKQTNAGTLVYCYLRFTDEDAANRYFRDYYNINSEQIDQYTKLYATEIKMADNLLYLNIAGNMLTYEGEEGWSVLGSTDSTGNLEQSKRISSMKDDVFKSLSAKLMRTSNQLTDAELQRTAFTNIIDETEVEIILHEKYTEEAQIDTLGVDPDSLILTKKAEYVVDSHTPSSVKMIVSLGNVTVKKDFKGLIIAKGNITVEAGGSITMEPIDSETFSNILCTKIDELSVDRDYYLLNIFTDGVNYVNSGSTSYDMGTERVSLVDLISYERWSKK